MPPAPAPVIDALHQSLGLHWTAIEFYSSLSSWLAPQYPKLGEKFAADAEEERGHAKRLMDRLRFFDQPPAFDHDEPPAPNAANYSETLANALALETDAAAAETAGIRIAREHADEQTARVFIKLQKGSEESILEIEAAQLTIEEIGLENYLALFA